MYICIMHIYIYKGYSILHDVIVYLGVEGNYRGPKDPEPIIIIIIIIIINIYIYIYIHIYTTTYYH